MPTLRVLMLGKNRIRGIENLAPLTKLDVLDLHSNLISKVENLSTLSELRVLNLAGNQIRRVENIAHLQSLTELNVRRNQIENAFELDRLPGLQRIFMSNNAVRTFADVESLFHVRYLMELSLDGNPLASGDPVAYRRGLLDRIRSLRHLDLKRVTDGERRTAVAENKRIEENRAAEQREAAAAEEKRIEGEKRTKAIEVAERSWLEEQEAKAASVQLAEARRTDALAAAAKALRESEEREAELTAGIHKKTCGEQLGSGMLNGRGDGASKSSKDSSALSDKRRHSHDSGGGGDLSSSSSSRGDGVGGSGGGALDGWRSNSFEAVESSWIEGGSGGPTTPPENGRRHVNPRRQRHLQQQHFSLPRHERDDQDSCVASVGMDGLLEVPSLSRGGHLLELEQSLGAGHAGFVEEGRWRSNATAAPSKACVENDNLPEGDWVDGNRQGTKATAGGGHHISGGEKAVGGALFPGDKRNTRTTNGHRTSASKRRQATAGSSACGGSGSDACSSSSTGIGGGGIDVGGGSNKTGFFEFKPSKELPMPERGRFLSIYGEAWECFEHSRVLGGVTSLEIKYVAVGRIAEKAIPKLSTGAMPRLTSMRLSENAIRSFAQLKHLITVAALSREKLVSSSTAITGTSAVGASMPPPSVSSLAALSSSSTSSVSASRVPTPPSLTDPAAEVGGGGVEQCGKGGLLRDGDANPQDSGVNVHSDTASCSVGSGKLEDSGEASGIREGGSDFYNETGCLGRLLHLEIVDNAVCDLALLRSFVAFHLPHLATFNGKPLTHRERDEAKKMLQPTNALIKAQAQRQSMFKSPQGFGANTSSVAAGGVNGATSLSSSSSNSTSSSCHAKKRSSSDSRPLRMPSSSSSGNSIGSVGGSGGTHGSSQVEHLGVIRVSLAQDAAARLLHAFGIDRYI